MAPAPDGIAVVLVPGAPVSGALGLGNQPPPPVTAPQPLHGHVAGQNGDDDLTRPGPDTAIHNEKVAVEDPGAGHGGSGNPDDEGGRRMLDQVV